MCVCVCDNATSKTVEKIISIFCNVLLNNYVKYKNDGIGEKRSQQKRKLHSLTQ